MKTKLLTILAFALVIQSCKKKDEPAPVTQTAITGCLVQNIKLDGQTFMTYTFDNTYKISSFVLVNPFSGATTTNQVTYSGNTMTTKEYNSNNTLTNTTVAVLNTDDNISSSIATGIDTLYSTTPLARNVYDTATYEYDANKFLIKEIHKIRTVEIISGNTEFKNDSTGFVIQNENVVSVSHKIIFSSGSVQTSSATYTYGTDLNKSGQMVGIYDAMIVPLPHKGKMNKYLVHTITTPGNSPDTYTYTFDSNGYVTEQTGAFFPLSFTYLCH